jgi:hypothetical protein
MTASKRSPRSDGERVFATAGGAGRDDCAWIASVRFNKQVPAIPPAKAQAPRRKVLANRFIGGVTAKLGS